MILCFHIYMHGITFRDTFTIRTINYQVILIHVLSGGDETMNASDAGYNAVKAIFFLKIYVKF